MEYGLPEHMIAAIRRYVDDRIEPGGFLSAVICNDLKQAAGLADHINKHLLFEYVQYFYNETPSDCWGTEEKFNSWLSTQ